MFDTLMYAKKLEASGMTRDQAEAQVNVIAEMVVNGVATKQDIALQQMATSKEFAELRLEINGQFSAAREEFAAVRSEMSAGFAKADEKLSALRTETLRAMGAMFVLSTTIIIGVISWIVK